MVILPAFVPVLLNQKTNVVSAIAGGVLLRFNALTCVCVRGLCAVQDAANSLGVVVLRDTKPDEEAELIDILSPPANLDDEAAEPGPPEPFEWKPTPY